jgi:Holliday junction resolvase RusA-like endonuclease
MSRSWTILLEMPPVAKGRPRFSGKHVYTPSKTKAFETKAKLLMKKQFYMQPLTGPLRAEIDFVFSRPKRPKHKYHHIVRPDADNISKAVLDSGNGILYEDDSQVCQLAARKFYTEGAMSPRIVLTITALDAT